jgi:hypothetical protein
MPWYCTYIYAYFYLNFAKLAKMEIMQRKLVKDAHIEFNGICEEFTVEKSHL